MKFYNVEIGRCDTGVTITIAVPDAYELVRGYYPWSPVYNINESSSSCEIELCDLVLKQDILYLSDDQKDTLKKAFEQGE